MTVDTACSNDSLATAVTAAGYLGSIQLGVGVTAQTLQQLCSRLQQFPSVQQLCIIQDVAVIEFVFGAGNHLDFSLRFFTEQRNLFLLSHL